MRSLYLLSLITLSVLASCQTDQKKVDEIANDMCRALSNYSEDDSRSLLEAATNLEKVNLKYNVDEDICPAQLQSTMEKICPDGYKKLVKQVE